MQAPMRVYRFFLVFILLSFLLTGCAPSEFVRGHVVRDYRVSDFKIGETTKKEILSLVGSPSLVSADGSSWYYVSSRSVSASLFPEKIKDRQLYELTFDGQGMLSGWDRRGGEGFLVVDMDTGVTKDPDAELNIFRELFGRIGSIDFRNKSQ